MYIDKIKCLTLTMRSFDIIAYFIRFHIEDS